MVREPEIVWLHDERTYAILVSMGAYYSKVKYTRGGIDYELIVDNDDFETWEERAIEHTED